MVKSVEAGRGGFFYGWVVVVVATVATVATSPGQSYLVGLFNESIGESLGLSERQITLAYGIATACAALPLLVVGKIADRFGPRVVMVGSAVGLGLACYAIGFVEGIWSLGVVYFFIRFMGQGALGLSASHSLAMWFEKKLGTVTGIKSFAMSAGIAGLPALTVWLIDGFGWRFAYAVLGVVVVAVVVPMAVVLLKNKPEDIGQRVDGEAAGEGEMKHPHAHPDAELRAFPANEQPMAEDLQDDVVELKLEGSEGDFTLGEALRTGAFWIMTGAMVMQAALGTAMVFLLGSLAREAGREGESPEAWLFTVFAVATGVLNPVVGVMADRVRPSYIVAMSTGLLAVSFALFAFAGVPLMAEASLVALAGAQTIIFVALSSLFAKFYGRSHHGVIRSSLTFFMVVGTSIGPFVVAWLRDEMGQRGALLVCAGMCVPLVVSGLRLRRPVKGE